MDKGIRILLGGGEAFAMLMKATDTVEQARVTHDLWPVTCAALGRSLMSGVFMGQSLKVADGTLTLSIRGGGPAGTIVVSADNSGAVKGYVDVPHVDLPLKANGKLDVGGAVGYDGKVTVIRRRSGGEPYIGQCPLVSGEIAEDLTYYYATSEQQPTLLSLGVLVNPDGSVQSAAGLIVQPLPGCSDEFLTQLEQLAPTLGDIALRLSGCELPEEAVESLFPQMETEIVGTFTPMFRCDCSRERMEEALAALGRRDLLEMADEGDTEIVCHFCNKAYTFAPDELRHLCAQSEDAN